MTMCYVELYLSGFMARSRYINIHSYCRYYILLKMNFLCTVKQSDNYFMK